MSRRIQSLMACALALAVAGAAPAPVPADDAILTPEAVEARISGKLKDRLDLLLQAAEYRVLVTAKVRNARERVQTEGQTQSQSTGQEAASRAAEQLPGFQPAAAPKPAAKDIERKESARYVFRNKSEVESVSVRLVLDKHLEQAVKDIATAAAKETVQLTAGNAARFEAAEIELVRPDPAAGDAGWWSWIARYLDARGGSAIDLLYLSLLLVALLGAVLAVRRAFKDKKAAAASLPAAAGDAIARRDEDALACEQKLDALIGALASSPLLTRNFLHQLDQDDKQTLLSALRTPALQSMLRRIVGLGDAAGTAAPAQAPRPVLERILKDLERYIRLSEEMEAKPFGYLPQMTGRQLVPAVLAEQDRLAALAIVGPHLSAAQVKELTRHLSVDEKAAFLAGGHSDKPQAADSPERQRLDERLRARFHGVRHEVAAGHAEEGSLEASLLDADMDAVAVVKRLATLHGTMPRRYEKYLVDFEQLLGLDLGIGRAVFQRVSNETLARALADRPSDPRLVELLGEIRYQLVDSLRQRGERLSARDIAEAQNEVVRHYRSVV